MSRVLAAAAAELPKLQALRGRLFILRRYVITTFTIRALKHNVIARHNLPLKSFTSYRPENSTDSQTLQSVVHLFDDFRDSAGADRSPTLTNGKA